MYCFQNLGSRCDFEARQPREPAGIGAETRVDFQLLFDEEGSFGDNDACKDVSYGGSKKFAPDYHRPAISRELMYISKKPTSVGFNK